MTVRAKEAERHRVVIVGAGFGGLWAVKSLKGAPVDIIVVDQRNHHLFQPLLYQVATASLAPSEIAWPIRSMLHDRHDVTTILATVTGVDMAGRAVQLADGNRIVYDTLILATGARHGYFGHDEWEAFAMAEIGMPHARCEHQSVIGDPVAIFEDDLAIGRIDIDHRAEQGRDLLASSEEMANRPGDLGSCKRGRGHLIEQGLKQVVVALIDNGDPHGCASQAMRDFQPAEAASDDDDMME